MVQVWCKTVTDSYHMAGWGGGRGSASRSFQHRLFSASSFPLPSLTARLHESRWLAMSYQFAWFLSHWIKDLMVVSLNRRLGAGFSSLLQILQTGGCVGDNGLYRCTYKYIHRRTVHQHMTRLWIHTYTSQDFTSSRWSSRPSWLIFANDLVLLFLQVPKKILRSIATEKPIYLIFLMTFKVLCIITGFKEAKTASQPWQQLAMKISSLGTI